MPKWALQFTKVAVLNIFQLNNSVTVSSALYYHGCNYIITFFASGPALWLALNNLWKKRLEDATTALKKKHAQDLREHKRQLLHQIPASAVIAKAQINRLQHDVNQMRFDKLLKGQKGGNLLKLSLATVEQLSKQVLRSHEFHLSLFSFLGG